MCLAQQQAEHRGQLFSVSAFRRTAEACQVGNVAVCEGPPFTMSELFLQRIVIYLLSKFVWSATINICSCNDFSKDYAMPFGVNCDGWL